MPNTFTEDLLLNNFERLLRHENPGNTNFSKFYDMRNYIQSLVNVSQYNVISSKLDELIIEYSQPATSVKSEVTPALGTPALVTPIVVTEQLTVLELLKQIKKELLKSHDTEIIDKYIYKFFTTLLIDQKETYNGITASDIYKLTDKIKNLCSNLILKEINIEEIKEKKDQDEEKLNEVLKICKNLDNDAYKEKILELLNNIDRLTTEISSEPPGPPPPIPSAAPFPPPIPSAGPVIPPQNKTQQLLELKKSLYYEYEIYKIKKNTPLNLTILQIDTDRYVWQKTINIFKPLFDILRSQSENVMYGGSNIILLATIKDKIKEQIINIKPKASLD